MKRSSANPDDPRHGRLRSGFTPALEAAILSAKGGVALAIEKLTSVPIKFIGTGEALSDLAPFDPASYIASLFE